MRCLLGILLTLAASGEWCAAYAQAASDTLPKRVISQAYDAFNRHDPVAFLSFFAPVWYHTVLEDTAAAPRRQIRDENIRDFLAMKVFATVTTTLQLWECPTSTSGPSTPEAASTDSRSSAKSGRSLLWMVGWLPP